MAPAGMAASVRVPCPRLVDFGSTATERPIAVSRIDGPTSRHTLTSISTIRLRLTRRFNGTLAALASRAILVPERSDEAAVPLFRGVYREIAIETTGDAAPMPSGFAERIALRM